LVSSIITADDVTTKAEETSYKNEEILEDIPTEKSSSRSISEALSERTSTSTSTSIKSISEASSTSNRSAVECNTEKKTTTHNKSGDDVSATEEIVDMSGASSLSKDLKKLKYIAGKK